MHQSVATLLETGRENESDELQLALRDRVSSLERWLVLQPHPKLRWQRQEDRIRETTRLQNIDKVALVGEQLASKPLQISSTVATISASCHPIANTPHHRNT